MDGKLARPTPTGSQLKRTMIKDTVGNARRSAYDLPKSEHEYGLKAVRDRENAGTVMTSWDTGTRSTKGKPDRSFVSTNKKAIIAGNLTSKDCRLFAESNKDIVTRPQRKSRGMMQLPPNTTFGQPTPESNSSIEELVQGRLTNYGSTENVDYPDMKGLQKKGKLPLPKATNCSRGMDVRTLGCTGEPKPAPSETKWKLKKFQNVPSKGVY